MTSHKGVEDADMTELFVYFLLKNVWMDMPLIF